MIPLVRVHNVFRERTLYNVKRDEVLSDAENSFFQKYCLKKCKLKILLVASLKRVLANEHTIHL